MHLARIVKKKNKGGLPLFGRPRSVEKKSVCCSLLPSPVARSRPGCDLPAARLHLLLDTGLLGLGFC